MATAEAPTTARARSSRVDVHVVANNDPFSPCRAVSRCRWVAPSAGTRSFSSRFFSPLQRSTLDRAAEIRSPLQRPRVEFF